MEEIVGNGNLTRFKDEYQKVWKMLKSSYEQERRTTKAARTIVDRIFESA
jgi:lysozyme family protein